MSLTLVVNAMSTTMKNNWDNKSIDELLVQTEDNESTETSEVSDVNGNIVVKDNENEKLVVCSNAVVGLTDDEYDEILDDMYEEVDEDHIEELDDMEPTEINDILNSFDDKYEVGEPLSEEDQAVFLYVYENVIADDKNEETNDKKMAEAQPLGWETLTYKIGWNKEKAGVKTSYSGEFKTWTGSMHGKYETDVNVKIEKGKKKLKSMKWTTYHDAYGILGTSGKSPSIGKVYTGSTSSSKYKKNFSFDKSVTYSAIWVVYISTHGKLDVKYDGGEYNIQTKTYKSVE